MTRASKYERQKALSAALSSAGFQRRGADHVRDHGEIKWGVFLSTVRKEGDVEFDVSFYGADRERSTSGNLVFLVNQWMGLMPGASRSPYRGSDETGVDPMIRDVEDVLLPVISRTSTRGAVVDEWLSGTWGWVTEPRSSQIAHGWKLARELNLKEQEQRARDLVAHGIWSPTDRWYFRSAGFDIGGPYRDPTKLTLWDRLRGFS